MPYTDTISPINTTALPEHIIPLPCGFREIFWKGKEVYGLRLNNELLHRRNEKKEKKRKKKWVTANRGGDP